jgi:hypothetical protein
LSVGKDEKGCHCGIQSHHGRIICRPAIKNDSGAGKPLPPSFCQTTSLLSHGDCSGAHRLLSFDSRIAANQQWERLFQDDLASINADR